ncbi:hypothetical protein N566_26855 [Streptomycetaceae bacterium MP113-05]|nr:hypothetical protein N566_26855 [Streptomycetaceae bacterium MP113-05]
MSIFLIAAPAGMAIVGYVLLFNVRGVADYLYLHFLQNLAAGVPPRTLRVGGAFAAFRGTTSLVVEVISRLA